MHRAQRFLGSTRSDGLDGRRAAAISTRKIGGVAEHMTQRGPFRGAVGTTPAARPGSRPPAHVVEPIPGARRTAPAAICSRWRRWQPFAFVGTHPLPVPCRTRSAVRSGPRCGRGVVRVMFGWSRHKFLPCGVRENAISSAGGIDLDQSPLPQVPSDSVPRAVMARARTLRRGWLAVLPAMPTSTSAETPPGSAVGRNATRPDLCRRLTQPPPSDCRERPDPNITVAAAGKDRNGDQTLRNHRRHNGISP